MFRPLFRPSSAHIPIYKHAFFKIILPDPKVSTDIYMSTIKTLIKKLTDLPHNHDPGSKRRPITLNKIQTHNLN